MLEKIEGAYLAVMRVIVLVGATLALIVCIVGAGFAAPVVLKQLGVADSRKGAADPALATFIQEQRAAGASLESLTADAAAPEVTIIPGKVAKAANLVADYIDTQRGGRIDRVELQRLLKEKRDEVDGPYQQSYEDSLLQLATDLKGSGGKPLSFRRVGQLLDWHFERFQQGIAAQKAEAAAKVEKAQAGLMLAGGGLAAFIVILFFFLFVKIERNLRLVRTKEVGP